MKHRYAILILLSLISTIPAAKNGPSDDIWIMAKASADDSSLSIYRYLEQKPESWKTMSEEISIIWKFDGNLPDDSISKSMNDFEALTKPLAKGRDSHLVLVTTGKGQREWCFYAKDFDGFSKQMDECLTNKPSIPISTKHSEDPLWRYWQSYEGLLEKK